MANAPPPIAEHLVPDDRTVYRALLYPSWAKRGKVTWKAFMLRPATDEYPIEQELSLGLSPESAIADLNETHGVAVLSVRQIHSLPHGLTVKPNLADKAMAQVGRTAATVYSVSKGLSVPLRSSIYRGLQSSTYGISATLEEAVPYAQVGIAGGQALYTAGSAAYNGECH